MYRDSTETRKQIVQTGRVTWELGLNSLKSGNISVLLANRGILITRTGRSLRDLKPHKDLITIPPSQTGRGEASCEFDVHRAIYEMTACAGGAILHCHAPCSIAASLLLRRSIPPAYNEAGDVLGSIAILESRDRESLGEDPASIGQALSLNKIVAVRAHGTFALAQTLEQCLYLTHLLESSCRVLFLRSNGHRFSSLFEEAAPGAGSVVKLQAGTRGGQARK